MIKIDLVTGFLGSGKTTFIKKYAKYFLDKGLKIGILENDYGATNVDLMLLGDLIGENCEVEMIIGGDDLETHKRRFKTKLIAMAMSGYDRIIVEPSGIFEPEEFFDLLYEEPLDKWYELGSVITIVDVEFEADMSEDSEYLFATQLASAGAIVFSKQEKFRYKDAGGTIDYLNSLLEKIKCKRKIADKDIVSSSGKFENCNFQAISEMGYIVTDYEKKFYKFKNYSSIFVMDSQLTKSDLLKNIKIIFSDCKKFGNVIRIKGFIKENNEYYFINITKKNIETDKIDRGQDVLIVIGEELNEINIREKLNK